jgi:alpha-amylase/alpha-mannosidase (GH57 family)
MATQLRRRTIGVDAIYRPYRWVQKGREIRVVFRDHFLSDLIGFVYSRMGAAEAAEDFLRRIRENCRPVLATGRDALVPIILDGENAWEYYPHNGRPFLRELYRRISDDPAMTAATMSEALAKIQPDTLSHIFPGSWINANFDVWIGAEEDNQAWAHLLRARQAYDAAANVSEDRRQLAHEELLIAEGSDWCWWYGPEHDSANRVEFDQLYRSHLANVYRALGRTPPEDLSRPILRVLIGEVHVDPSGIVHPTIDGAVTSYFEWIGAGLYRVDERSGAMHGKKFLVQELYYGSDGENLYIRADFHPGAEDTIAATEVRLNAEARDSGHVSSATIRFDHGRAHATDLKLAAAPQAHTLAVECAYEKILEIRLSLDALGVQRGGSVRFQLSIWQGGLPMDAMPQQGWFELPTSEPADWSV